MKATLPNIRKLAGRGRTKKSAGSEDKQHGHIGQVEGAAEPKPPPLRPVPVLHAVPLGRRRAGSPGRGEAGGVRDDGAELDEPKLGPSPVP